MQKCMKSVGVSVWPCDLTRSDSEVFCMSHPSALILMYAAVCTSSAMSLRLRPEAFVYASSSFFFLIACVKETESLHLYSLVNQAEQSVLLFNHTETLSTFAQQLRRRHELTWEDKIQAFIMEYRWEFFRGLYCVGWKGYGWVMKHFKLVYRPLDVTSDGNIFLLCVF